MNTYKIRTIKERFLKNIYNLFPFRISGDLSGPLPPLKENFISCLICTAREPSLLIALLMDIKQQSLDKELFEVLILDNSLKGIKDSIKKYFNLFSLKYIRNNTTQGELGKLRNELLLNAQGNYILFLDDDTRLIQNDFLEKAISIFKISNPDVIMPFGKALLCPQKPNYKILDSYSFATRCCLYKRSSLEAIRGCRNLITYDDIELGIRMELWGGKVLKTDELEYYHPALYFDSLKKPIAIGQSIFQLRKSYPWYAWLLIYINALRFLPCILIPTTENRQWFKISFGVLIAPFIKKKFTYFPKEPVIHAQTLS